ncbi:MAG TPA: hypothetical protein DEG17_27480, partial [Cyanobacteria bacterium UBA11149]|nr:hypothetical protein [Cyanobacteria bacterium UBA11153]HBW92501.1 hypothetical protein [Cyanobacteria bacterium UBA11149]
TGLYGIIRNYTGLYFTILLTVGVLAKRGVSLAFVSLIYATTRITFIRKCFTLPPRDKPDSKYSTEISAKMRFPTHDNQTNNTTPKYLPANAIAIL